VFEASVSAGCKRLVYASSVAAYGFHGENPQPLTEDVPARGSAAHYYSAQKAEVETLLASTLAGTTTAAYVLRPCIVAGPQAPLLIDSLPYTQISERLPRPVLRLLDGVPILKPVLPDPGVPFQLVHHDDVASATRAAVLGRGNPGAYNLAGPGQLTVRELAEELGWYSIPLPELAVDAAADMIGRLGFLPSQAQWIAALREPTIMSTAKARRELGWRPRHDALSTLRETIAATRLERLIR
jgi:UDP-glucose 4-epimerase